MARPSKNKRGKGEFAGMKVNILRGLNTRVAIGTPGQGEQRGGAADICSQSETGESRAPSRI